MRSVLSRSMGSDQIMNSTLKYLGLLAILPLFTMTLTTDYVIEEVDATKSKGSDAPGRVGTQSFGSANKGVICGDRLCSEYPGGYEQFQKDQGQSAKIGSEAIEPEISEEKAMEDKMIEKKSTMKAMEEKMMKELESMTKTKETMEHPSEKTSMQMTKEVQTQNDVALEFSVPETIVAGELVPINARVHDSSNDANLSHTDWAYAIISSDGQIVHRTTTLHGHFGIMNLKDSFPEAGTYTIKYTVSSSGPFMLGMPVPELGQTRSVVSGDLLKFEEDPKNNFGSRTFEFAVDVINQGRTVILDGSEPDTSILVNFSTTPERIVAGQPAMLMIDVDDVKTGNDATHVDGLITISHGNYYPSTSGDQPDAPIPISLHGVYHGHLGVISTTHTFFQPGTYMIDVDLKAIPYSIPLFGQTSERFVIQVFDSEDTSVIMMGKIIKDDTVNIVGLESPFFTPNTIEVSAGQTIMFDNADGNHHTVTSVKAGTTEQDGKFDSNLLAPGEKFELTLNEKGTYSYYCALHVNMQGTIIVS